MAKSSASNDARPLIGLGCDNDVNKRERSHSNADNYRAIYKAGGLPVMVPCIDEDDYCREVVKRLDGLVLPGGDDVHSYLFDEPLHPRAELVTKRKMDADVALIRAALDADLPVLAICYTSQVLNVVLGGDMIQDIPSEVETDITHKILWPVTTFHSVTVEPGTILHDIVGTETLEINSAHHQANKNVAAPLIVSSWAGDGIIESVESTQHQFVVGVQWHPERITDRPQQFALFERLVAESKKRRAGAA